MGDFHHFSTSSRYLKFASTSLILAMILHIVGFSTSNWSSVHFNESKNKSDFLWFKGTDHAGLWQICSCLDIFGNNVCSCIGRHGDPVWFKITQTLETIVLIGLTISGFISMIQLCSRQDKNLKRINVFINIGSGMCGVLGLTVYGIKFHSETDDMLALYEFFYSGVTGYLDFSFYLCCISIALYLLVCAPLYMKDENIQAPTDIQLSPIVYNNQGQIIIPTEMQGATTITDIGRENAGYIPPPFPQPPFYPPPAYNADSRQEQTDSQYFQSYDGIPYKT